jgi:hypothetical protein
LEGPFADSILESDFLVEETCRLKVSSRLDAAEAAPDDRHQSLELLKKLKDRMLENRRKFRWKTIFRKKPDMIRDTYSDFV